MGLFQNIFKRNSETETVKEERSISLGGLGFNGWSSFSNSQAMKLSAVYAAVNQISNSCALLPFEIYQTKEDGSKVKVQHSLHNVLNYKPDNIHTHYAFVKQMIESVILRGNAYAYIFRDENLNVKELKYIDSNYVTPLVQDGGVKYLVAGLKSAVDAVNMIHLYQHIDENFNGISLIKYASNALRGAADEEKCSEQFYRGGANMSGIIKAQQRMDNEQRQQVRVSWREAFNNNSNSDYVRVAVLPYGWDYQAISVNPEDAQLLSARAFSVIEIARFFNISPVKLFDLSHSSYGSLEQTQLSYLQDTIFPYIKMMEDEFNLKLFKPSEFAKYEVGMDFSILLSTDMETQANYYKALLTNGILSLNEVRGKMGFSPVDGGDERYMQLNMTTLSNIIKGANVNNQIDNKLK